MSEKISVIIPAHNNEDTIARAIKSVLHQTYTNVEVIVIINGSVDRTEQIVRDLAVKNSNIRVFLSKQGRSRARNLGLDVAEGSYIQFLDADDYLLDDKLQTGVRYLENNSKYFAVVSDVYYEFQDGSRNSMHIIFNKHSDLLGRNVLPINSVIFRASSPVRFRTDLEYNEDWLFWVDLFSGMSIKKMSSNADSVVSVTGSNTMKHFEIMRLYQVYVRSIIKKRYSAADLKLWWRDFRYALLFCTMDRPDAFSHIFERIELSSLKSEILIARLLLHFPGIKSIVKSKENSLRIRNAYHS